MKGCEASEGSMGRDVVPHDDEFRLSPAEQDILRRLGAEVAEIARAPVNAERAELWCGLNDLRSIRPMVWINEIPWHEMNVDDELTLRTKHAWARELETRLRRTIYQWRHMPADTVVSDYIECPIAIRSTGFGIEEDVEVARTDAASEVVSRHFKAQIRDPDDIQKIQMPIVTEDRYSTDVSFDTMQKLFKEVISVRKVGRTHIWYTPWDYLVRWWGLEEAMMDFVMRPDMVNAAVERMVDAWMAELDQLVAQNLLWLNCSNIRIGSGGYGYTSDLPRSGFDLQRVSPADMWGCSNAQIFSQVSPEMHWEFALRHDIRWLSRWGLVYYGCCEPLDRKIHLLRRIPNLRKISVSPWNDFDRAIQEIGGDYVFSFKPNPAIFAEENWSVEKARSYLRDILRKTEKACHVEIIMKDISTVHYKPERLWEWSRVAMETAAEFCER